MAAEDKQLAYKEMIINFIQRYFYMICFGQYALQNGYNGYPETFATWFKNCKDDLHTMIENGKVGCNHCHWGFDTTFFSG